jgi:hypothetical protein
MVLMGKKTSRSGREKDRHSSHKMVRLPEDFHNAIKELAKRNFRSLTGEILLALEKHLRDSGVNPPPRP